jgi:rare lipoprotein A
VTNLDNHQSILVRVNDRGPFVGNRIIDLSRKAAQVLGFYGQGLTKVKVDYVGPAPLAGSDERTLIQSLRQNTPAGQARVQTAANATLIPRHVDSRGISGKPVRARHINTAAAANETPLMTSVSAYAAPRSEAGINVLTSGRGLY